MHPNDRDIQRPNWWFEPDWDPVGEDYEEYTGPDCSHDEEEYE